MISNQNLRHLEQSADPVPLLQGRDTVGKRLLVISHACVTAVNQSFYADVSRVTGWSVDLVIPSSWNSEYQEGVKVSRLPEFKGEIYPIPVWKPGNIPLHVYRDTLIRLFREVRPSYIYVHHEPYGLATAQCYLANRLSVNCPIGFYAAQNICKTYPTPFRWLEQLVLRHSDFCFPVTEGALEVLRSKGYGGVAEVLPLALDRTIYYPRPEWAAKKRQELGIADDEFVIGYMGRLVEEKGLKTLLIAAHKLRNKRWRIVLVGSGPYESALRTVAHEIGISDQVIFAGYVPHGEAPGWLTLFDVLVLASESRPNWKEQFGRVIIEANACETPVIGTESGEIGNVIRATAGGLIVNECDSDGLGKALTTLAENPVFAQALGRKGAAAVEEKYDQVALASRFAQTIVAATTTSRV